MSEFRPCRSYEPYDGGFQEFCACVYDIWETIYRDGESNLSHEKMLETLMQHLGEKAIDTYGRNLFKLYPERCLKVLANAADRQARLSQNRRDYKRIAKILKKIAAHPGGKELAAELAAKYRAQYPRRTAMIDELKKF